ncbi:MAG: sulfatase-like hydrolase/transferase, partial [Planctomycetota bacterium]
MKKRLVRTAFLYIWSSALFAFPSAAQQPDSVRPNIVFMLSDDQHWDEHGVPMHPEVSYAHTPNLDTPRLKALAEQGMRFSAAYAPAPVCSPTRISLQTGISPAALRWTKAGPSVRSSANAPMLVPTSDRAI